MSALHLSPGVVALGILLATVVLLAWGRWRPDAVAILVPVVLVTSGLSPVEEALSGFGNPAVVAMAGVLVLSAALERTGIAASLARRLRSNVSSESSLALALMLTAAGLSGFMNSLGAIAVLLPVTAAACQQRDIPPSRLLLPVALSARLGGVLTLVAGPSNLLASRMLQEATGRPFAMFEFLPLGLAFVAVGAGFFLLVGRRLLPARTSGHRAHRPASPALAELYRMHERVREARVKANSALAGRPLSQTPLAEAGVLVLALRRGNRAQPLPVPQEVILAGDRLLLAGVRDETVLSRLEEMGLELQPPDRVDLEFTGVGLAEVVIPPRSAVAGRTVRQLDFRRRYGVSVLAIWRKDQPRRSAVADVPLEVGDAILLQGPRHRFRALASDPDFILLQEQPAQALGWRGPAALAVVGVTSAAAGLGWADVSVAVLAGAVTVVGLGCLPGEDVYRVVDWRSVVFLACLLPLSGVLLRTRAVDSLVAPLLQVGGSPLGTFAALYAAAILLNQLLPSVAATVVLTPVALEAATRLGASPAALVMAVVAATATTFTPLGNPVNLLVMAPGGYTLRDYLRAGLPLAVLLYLLGLWLVPTAWPLVRS